MIAAYPFPELEGLENPFGEIEAEAWQPPEDITPTEWADRYRILGAEVARISGQYRSDRVPYARGIMDALGDLEHREVYFQKPVQCGGSELGRNWLAWTIDIDPGPTMVVFPSQDACRETIEERIVPMLRDCPRLARLKTGNEHDIRKGVIKLLSCSIYTGWSGSPQALASRPIRYLLLDEMDKFQVWRGVEADAASLARDRTLTYLHKRKVFGLSTPTIPEGAIAKAVAACGDIRDYCIRCVACERLQVPKWEQVSWAGMEGGDEDALKENRRALEAREIEAVYACHFDDCDAEMVQADFWRGVKAGAWVSEGYAAGEHPKSESLGFRLSGLCSPWLGVQRLAMEFQAAKLEGMGALQNFWNAFLGLPFFDSEGQGDAATEITQQRIWELAADGGERLDVPDWTNGVVAGMDTGKADHPYVIRAFGAGFKSQLLEIGSAKTPGDIYKLLELDLKGERKGKMQTYRVARICLDSGGGEGKLGSSRTEQVYRIAQKEPERIWAIKGYGSSKSRMPNPIYTREINYRKKGEIHGPTLDVRLSTLDVHYWKDVLAGYIARGIWHPFRGVPRDYVAQVAAERKKFKRRETTADGLSREVWMWEPKTAGLANHYFDCEVYAVAAAHMLGLDELGDWIEETRARDAELEHDDYLEEDTGSGWTSPGHFTRGGSWN